VASLYGRGVAKRRKGDVAGGNADIAAARAIKADVAAEFARYGLQPPVNEAVRTGDHRAQQQHRYQPNQRGFR
jgi:hypothetical protein